jgi:hypothetical protein
MFQQPLEQYWKQQQQQAIKDGIHPSNNVANHGGASSSAS